MPSVAFADLLSDKCFGENRKHIHFQLYLDIIT